MLLFLFSFFVVMVLWLFRPSAKQEHTSSADIPFRHELAPAPVDDIEEPRT
jgi:cytochrome c oxidase cbb3-type subunit 4